jgi:hypothetical protein
MSLRIASNTPMPYPCPFPTLTQGNQRTRQPWTHRRMLVVSTSYALHYSCLCSCLTSLLSSFLRSRRSPAFKFNFSNFLAVLLPPGFSNDIPKCLPTFALVSTLLVGGEPKVFSRVFLIWEPFMAQSQDKLDGVCDWS